MRLKLLMFLWICLLPYAAKGEEMTPQKALAQRLADAVTEYNHGALRVRRMVRDSKGYSRWMRILCESRKMRCTPENYRNKLLSRVELLMPSDVIARAAFYSKWGRTREARMGNNYFGLQCVASLCGFKVADSKKSPQLTSFKSLSQAIDALADNIYASQSIDTLASTGFFMLESDLAGKIIQKEITPTERNDLITAYDLYQYDKQMFASLSIETAYPLEHIVRFADYLPSSLFVSLFESNNVS